LSLLPPAREGHGARSQVLDNIFAFIFLVQVLGSPDPERTFFPWLPVSMSGLHTAALTCWRLGLMLCYGVLFTLVTKPRDLQNALIWFLKPFPFCRRRESR